MISSQPGDPIWIREGVFIANEVCNAGLPVGTILNKPKRGIFLERKIINSKTYIKTYIDSIGERFVEECEVLELK
jgi:hypothetical protein